VNSSARFLFLSTTTSSESAGGGNIVELVLSNESLPSSPSWLSSASGASEAAKIGTFRMAPLLGEEGEKRGVDDSGKKTTQASKANDDKRKNKANKR
jgi:hypothetical protein